MPNVREVKLRIRSVKNISQVTRALQAVSASKVRKAQQAVLRTRAYSTKAWQVLQHIALQPGRASLHPLLAERPTIRNTMVIMISGDRGLAGAYNTNIMRFTHQTFADYPHPIQYVAVGRKGRDLLIRQGKNVVAEFSNLPAAPTFGDVSAVGRLAVNAFLNEEVDEVYLVYTDFVNLLRQVPTKKRLLPLGVEDAERVQDFSNGSKLAAAYVYEPGETEILDEIVPRFTALQVYHAVLESLASEHAARMVAMRNATENATELVGVLQLEYNKVRQQTITNEMLDIAGGAEALAQAEKNGGNNG